MADPALVLWDVDQTLVDVGGVSQEVYALAFEKVTGRPLAGMPDMVGRTEKAILVDVLAMHGVSLDTYDEFYTALSEATIALEGRIRRVVRSLPGAREAIESLAGDGIVQSVVTGNIRPIAETKLEAFDLGSGIDFDVGGYGDDDGSRAVLVRLAMERAIRKYDTMFPPARVVVIGDTPLDIAGAHAVGANAIGVATGRYTVDELTHSGADRVLPGLSETADISSAFIAVIRDAS